METIVDIQKEHAAIRAVLKKLKKEIVSLVIDQRIEKVSWAVSLAFIKDSVINFHNLREGECILRYKSAGEYKNLDEMMQTISERHELIEVEYDLLVNYWNLYQEGHTLARFNVMEEGEKMIRLLEESMRLEEKLFDLTTNECIVK